MTDNNNVNISITHDDSVDISQVLILPKAPITKPVMFSIVRQNTSGAGPNKDDGEEPSKGLDVGAESSAPVVSGLATMAASVASVPGTTVVAQADARVSDTEEIAPVASVASVSGTTVVAQADARVSDTEEIRADKDMSSPVSSGAAAVQPPSETEEDTPSPVIRRLKGHHKPTLKTYPEIFGWTDPDNDFYIGSQPQEYPPTSAVRSLFKDKGKRKADPPVYIKSEEEDSKRIRLFD